MTRMGSAGVEAALRRRVVCMQSPTDASSEPMRDTGTAPPGPSSSSSQPQQAGLPSSPPLLTSSHPPPPTAIKPVCKPAGHESSPPRTPGVATLGRSATSGAMGGARSVREREDALEV